MTPDDDAAALDLKMMAVLTTSPVPSLFSILRALCHAHLQDEHFDLGEPPKATVLFEKMGLSAPFWELVGQYFGYRPEHHTVAGLLRCLFVSELFAASGARVDALV